MQSSAEPTMPAAAVPQQRSTATRGLSVGRVELVALLAVFGLAIFTRLYQLGAESFWLDEATTYFRAKMPLSALFQNSVQKMHVPTYFVLIHYVLPFGDDEWTIRLPSAIFGMLKPLVVAAAGYVIAGPRAAITAALLLVLCPLQLHYDQEARMYAAQTFGTSLALLGLLWLLANPKQAVHCLGRNQLDQAVKARAAWAAYIAGTVFALYMHNTTGLFMLASSSAALVLMVADKEVRVRFFWHWVVANLLVLLLWAPWLPYLYQQLHTPRLARREWGGMPTPSQVGRLATSLFLDGEYRPLNALVLALALLGGWQLRKRPALLVALLVLSLSAPGLLWLVSLKKPMLMPRLTLWGGPAFYVIAGCGVAQLRRGSLQALALCAITVLGGLNLERRYYSATVKPDWRGAALIASQHDAPSVLLLPNSFREYKPLRYYASRTLDRIGIPKLDRGRRLARNPKRLQAFVRRERPERVVFIEGPRDDRPRSRTRLILANSLHHVRTDTLKRVVVEHFDAVAPTPPRKVKKRKAAAI